MPYNRAVHTKEARLRSVLCVPDTHFPFHHQPTLTWIYEIAKERKPDIIFQLGDLYDFFASSRFARSHDVMTPKEEFEEGRMGAEAMWKNLRKASPKSMCIQIKGNHDVRPNKRLLELCPELESLLDTDSLFKFPGVKTILDPSEEVEIDGVVYIHGHYAKLGDHMNFFLQPTVHGHTHKGGTIYKKIRGGTLWELDCGFASDETTVPMRYGPTRRNHWTLGCGWVDAQGPQFLPAPPVKK